MAGVREPGCPFFRPKLTDPDEVEAVLREYFEECRDDGIPPGVMGMAHAIGVHRNTLLNYEAEARSGKRTTAAAIGHAIARAKTYAGSQIERRLYDKDGVQGAKFNLACNFGWREPAAPQPGEDDLDDSQPLAIVIVDPSPEREADGD